MKTNVAETSIDNYIKSIALGITQKQERVIVAALLANPGGMTRKEIAKMLDMDTGTVAARVNALVSRGAIEEDGKRECFISGRTVGVVRTLQFELA